ncbi:transcriptional regulator, HxlR family [Pseudovibrio sp. FO-BEG1]|uniref:Helix-turn-helix transcriptional regulator n=1 Tax=Pseudovibrio brasiliensis TaxID=1898042 RepID=A0ABX8ASM4_9HYPH|nr:MULTISPECIES: helix-turn-helix domain-containing protein [Pseudovibrio]AEV37491.1 transcriptional regulator, HxlR family [Pseudovibrio sp. FO-BEG1]EEA92111.1 transcriptional regulator [Pseudovibrio sp. JE062]QUS56661.1 helix-turn-helix transcriptional regulator [Pseudovibrio brasiliensis]
MSSAEKVEPDAFVAICPSRQVLVRLAEKWTMLTIVALEGGPLRFGDLKRKVEGVSQKMLTQTLRNLEQDKLLTRKVYDEMPLRVEYELTALGKDLLPLIKQIKQWCEAHFNEIVAQ